MITTSTTGGEALSYLIRFFEEIPGGASMKFKTVLEQCACELEIETRWVTDFCEESYEDGWDFTLKFYAPPQHLPFCSSNEFKKEIKRAFDALVSEEGKPMACVKVKALLPEENRTIGLNNCFFLTEKTITHSELRFRSNAEISIYKELEKRKLLFFPNAAAILGGEKPEKREPDFLICYEGKWGILEVMGGAFHNTTTAVKDHDRARLFKDFGILCIEFLNATECRNKPAQVVEKFLSILARH